MIRVVLLILVACRPPVSATEMALDRAPDQRAAIQRALDTHGFASLTTGVADIYMAPTPSVGRRAYEMITLGKGQRLFGTGRDTVLRFHGDAGQQDWHGITILGDGAQVYDLTIDTSDLTNTSEQTHAVYIPGPVVSPLVSGVTFNHPQRGTQKGGDCVEMVGYPATPITGARILDNTFAHCDRSGVSWHSGVVDLQVTTSTFLDVGDQDVDGEGTGGNSNVVISLNTFNTSPTAQGDTAIELEGVDGAQVTDNTFNGRGIFLYGVQHGVIAYNDIERTKRGLGTPAITVEKDSADISIAHNTVHMADPGTAGNAIYAVPHGTGTPARLSITDNTVTQDTTASVVRTYGVVGLEVAMNDVTYSGGPGVFGVDAIGSVDTRTDQIVLTGNRFHGPLLAALRVGGSYAGTGSVSTSDNTAESPQGIRCESVYSGSKVLGPVTSARDAWPAPLCGIPGFVQLTER